MRRLEVILGAAGVDLKGMVPTRCRGFLSDQEDEVQSRVKQENKMHTIIDTASFNLRLSISSKALPSGPLLVTVIHVLACEAIQKSLG
jgi:hypothetical protein